MASLLAMLAQQTAMLQTRKGLILLGLQNDFVSPDGKLPVSAAMCGGIVDRLAALIPAFREFGDVIWVRSEFEATRSVNDDSGDTVIAGPAVPHPPPHRLKRKATAGDGEAPTKRAKSAPSSVDEELFLTRTSSHEPCCVPGSWGADCPDALAPLIDTAKDIQVVKTFYSAFSSTSLLLTLRSRLITELFVCGCKTNLSVFATAMDAARYGIKITLIEDCLGYRRKERHDEAIRQLVDVMGADVLSSDAVLDRLRNPPDEDDVDEDEDEDEDEDDGDDSSVANGVAGVRPRDAAISPADALIPADSDDEIDGDELTFPNVQSIRLPHRGLPFRTVGKLPPSPAAKPECRSPSAYTRPAYARLPSSPHAGVDGQPDQRPSDVAGQGRGQDRLGLFHNSNMRLPGASGRSAAASSESPENSNAMDSWLRGIDSPSSSLPASPSYAPPLDSPTYSKPRGPAALSALAQSSPGTVNNDNDDEGLARGRGTNGDAAMRTLQSTPLFGEGKETESAGSRMYYDLLPPERAERVFDELRAEVAWEHMHHQTGEVPRLVCCQGEIDEAGERPLYRHPSDQTLSVQRWSPTVDRVRKAAERVVGHPLNHVLIQLYRSGSDYISEHSDKTLDIVKGSHIVNVSFGAQRTMRLRTKRGAPPATPSPPPRRPGSRGANRGTPPSSRTTYRVPLPHNSMIAMSLETNAEYLHGINADKRPAVELSDAEKAYEGQRISLTFRHIGTYLNGDETRIWGQGATGKRKREAHPVISGAAAESEQLIRAFGAENQARRVDWESVYGEGSDVLHLKASPGS